MNHIGSHLDLNHKIQKLNLFEFSKLQLEAKEKIQRRLEYLNKTSANLIKYSHFIISRTREFAKSLLKEMQIQKNNLFNLLKLTAKVISEEEKK